MQVRPFSGEFTQKNVNNTLLLITALGLMPAIFNNLFMPYLTAMLVLFYISYYFLQSIFSAGLFMALFYQWNQVSIKIIHSLSSDQSLEEITKYPENIYSAFYLSAFTLFFLAAGMRQKLRKVEFSLDSLWDSIDQYSVKKFFVFYILFNVFLNLAYTLRFTIPGLFQAISILAYFKWTIFVMLMILVFRKGEMKTAFFLLVGFEFISSLVSFFASFKNIIIYLFIGITSVQKIRTKQIFSFGLGAIAVYLIAIIWTEIKMDYRQFLNKGTNTQAVLVTPEEARNYLITRIIEYDFNNFQETQKDLIDRISYIDFFSAMQSYVPSERPHENGKILQQSILHILMPRMFFPGKPIIEDSKHLTKYTGIYFPSYAEGVSFSLGYAGDFYIDFGPFFMFIGVFLFGYLLGGILLSIHKSSINPLWSIGAFAAAFNLLYKFENSQIKFLGNAIWFFLVFMFLNHFIIPKLHNMLKSNN